MPRFLSAAFGAALLLLMPSHAHADVGDHDWAHKTYKSHSEPKSAASPRRSRAGRNTSPKLETFSGVARLDPAPAKRQSGGCIPARLQTVLNDVEAKFGSVKVTSTCRSASANRSAGGAPRSLHLSGQAIDFRVPGGSRGVMAFLASHGDVGGLKHYGGGLYHIDTGPRRPF